MNGELQEVSSAFKLMAFAAAPLDDPSGDRRELALAKGHAILANLLSPEVRREAKIEVTLGQNSGSLEIGRCRMGDFFMAIELSVLPPFYALSWGPLILPPNPAIVSSAHAGPFSSWDVQKAFLNLCGRIIREQSVKDVVNGLDA